MVIVVVGQWRASVVMVMTVVTLALGHVAAIHLAEEDVRLALCVVAWCVEPRFEHLRCERVGQEREREFSFGSP